MSIGYWLIVLVIVMLIFGTKRLRDVRAELSVALRGFKDEMRERDRKPGDYRDMTEQDGKEESGGERGATTCRQLANH